MQTDIFMGMEVFTGILLPIILGLASAVARTAKLGWRGIGHFIAEGMVCIFVSTVVFWGLDAFPSISPTVRCAIASISAFWCNDILDWVRRRMRLEILTRWVPGKGGPQVGEMPDGLRDEDDFNGRS